MKIKMTKDQLKNYYDIINHLKSCNIDKKDFDKFLKLNKYSKYWLKKLSSKIKKNF